MSDLGTMIRGEIARQESERSNPKQLSQCKEQAINLCIDMYESFTYNEMLDRHHVERQAWYIGQNAMNLIMKQATGETK